MTVLEHFYWHQLKSKEQRAEFKKQVMRKTGVSESTFYRLLMFQPGKLIKESIAELSKIEADLLYQEQTITTLTPNTK